MKASEVIKALQATSSRLEKEAVIDKAWKEDCIDFFEGARLCFDKMITFGVKQIPEKDSNSEISKMQYADFSKLCDKLQQREITGNAAREAIENFMNDCDKDDWNNFYRLVLMKDLKAGVSEVTINKILKKQKSNRANNYIIKLFSCQLAYDCEGREARMGEEVLLEPKFDGVRILAVCRKENKTVTLYTRNGKENHNFPRVANAFQDLLDDLDQSYVFDGEIMSANFQALMKQLNRKDDVDTADSTYNVFDIIPFDHFDNGFSNIPQRTRKAMLAEMLPSSEYIKLVDYKIIDPKKEKEVFEKYKRDAVEAGLEGIMIKDPNAPYECKRNENWMKYKPVITVDLTVVGLEEGSGENAGMLGALVCEGEYEGKQVKVNAGSGYTDDLRKEIWANPNKIIGRLVEIEADCLTQSQGSETWSLRFPRFLRFRDDK